jgi:zinc transport system substrate-binding protein
MSSKTGSFIIVVTFIAMLFSSGCIQQGEVADGNGKIDVIVSILPQKEFVSSVGGEHVKVNELIPPGASPATYELRPSDAVNIENAKIYFRIGHVPFEKAHLSAIESMNPDMLVVDTSEGIQLRQLSEGEEHDHEHEEMNDAEDHEHEDVDPHIWLSTKNVMIQVETIYETLAGYDPGNAEEYRRNADEYIARLNDLDAELSRTLSAVATKKMMVFHPAWGYFADDYGFKQVAIESEGKEPMAQEIADIIDEAKEHGIKVIFVQSQFSTETAQSVAEQIDGAVVQINPLAEDYIDNLRQVGDTISANLGS